MLTSSLFQSLAHAGLAVARQSPTERGCDALRAQYPLSTIFPGTPRYDFENTYSWTSTAWLGPACVFAPTSAEDVSAAVKLFTKTGVPFAVRAGGGMTVDNAANIGPEGILISSTNMTTMEISDDNSVASVGPGIRWPQFYAYLDNFNRTVDGIRLGNVGVVGLLLGGGIGFFSYEQGSVSTEVQAFQCVLADGTITEASLTENSDLFWALRGGGNNFCIVTRADLRTIDVSAVDIGSVSYGTDSQKPYLKSLVDFAQNADIDPKAAVEGQIRWSPSTNIQKTYDSFIFHSGEGQLQLGPQNFSAPGLQNMTAPVLPVTGGEVVRQTMGQWSNAVDYASDAGKRQLWHSVSIPADADVFNIFVDSYFNGIAELANVPGFFTALAIMPITRRLLQKSEENGGSAIITPGQNEPQMWLVESASWPNASDDQVVFDAHKKANEDIKANIRAAGSDILPFVFLSAAQKTQTSDVFPSYGQENWQKLKEIRAKYDPNFVFTKLVPGGAKVEVQ